MLVVDESFGMTPRLCKQLLLLYLLVVSGLHNKAIGRLAKEALIEKNILSREVTADLAIVEQDMIRSRLLKSPRPYEEPMPTPMLFAPEGDGATLGASINLARTFTKEELMQQAIIPTDDDSGSGPKPLSRRPSLQAISGSRSQLIPDNLPMASMNMQLPSANAGPGELTFAKRRLSRLGPLPTEAPTASTGHTIPAFPPSSSSLGASEFPAAIPTRRASFVPTVSSPLVASSITAAVAPAGIEEKDENTSDVEESQDDDQGTEGNDEEKAQETHDEKQDQESIDIYSPTDKISKEIPDA